MNQVGIRNNESIRVFRRTSKRSKRGLNRGLESDESESRRDGSGLEKEEAGLEEDG